MTGNRRPTTQIPPQLPSFGRWMVFRTQSGPDGAEYPPPQDQPNVYHALPVADFDFPEEVGQQLAEHGGPHALGAQFVHVINGTYVVEGSYLLAFQTPQGQWVGL